MNYNSARTWLAVAVAMAMGLGLLAIPAAAWEAPFIQAGIPSNFLNLFGFDANEDLILEIGDAEGVLVTTDDTGTWFSESKGVDMSGVVAGATITVSDTDSNELHQFTAEALTIDEYFDPDGGEIGGTGPAGRDIVVEFQAADFSQGFPSFHVIYTVNMQIDQDGNWAVSYEGDEFDDIVENTFLVMVTLPSGMDATIVVAGRLPVDDPEPVDPATLGDCKRGGWETFGFRNQGQCLRYVNTGQDSR